MADCGPQCAHMPNLASRNHSGTSYLLKDARVPSKGPRSISIPGDVSCCAAPSFNAGSVPAISLQAVRLFILIDMFFSSPAVLSTGHASPANGASDLIMTSCGCAIGVRHGPGQLTDCYGCGYNSYIRSEDHDFRGVRQLKNGLTRYLRLVDQGQTIIGGSTALGRWRC